MGTPSLDGGLPELGAKTEDWEEHTKRKEHKNIITDTQQEAQEGQEGHDGQNYHLYKKDTGNEVFGVSLASFDDDLFTNKINFFLAAFDDSKCPRLKLFSERMMASYQEMLACIIAELRIQVQAANGIHATLLSAVTALLSASFTYLLKTDVLLVFEHTQNSSNMTMPEYF